MMMIDPISAVAPSLSSPPLYEQVARHLEHAIHSGVLGRGARLPSIRESSLQHGVSISTALAAYRHLENLRLIEARPKSGYFVLGRAGRARSAVVEPMRIEPACEVGVNARIVAIMHSTDACEVQFDLAVGAPEIYPSAKLQRLVASIARRDPGLMSRYPVGTGHIALTTQLARRALDYGCVLKPEDFIVTNASTEAMQLALRAVASTDDTVMVESPAYYGVLQALESLGIKALEIPTDTRTGISIEALEFATRDDHVERARIKALVVVPNFHNPLGSLMPDEHKRRMVELMAERGIPIIEDDVFGELHFDLRRPLVSKSWDRAGNVILCSSASKTMGPGLRLGWIVPGRWYDKVRQLKLTTSQSTSELTQVVVAEFMANGGYDHTMRRLRSMFKAQTCQVAHAVEKWFPEGTYFEMPQGGYLLWVRLPDGVSSEDVFVQARAQSIGVMPGLLFSSRERFRGYLRLSCGFPWSEHLEQGIRRLGELIARLADAGSSAADRP